jgi:membrane protease YdiL (CAAX protease family)
VTGSPGIGVAGWTFLVFAGAVLPLATAVFALSERRRVVDIEHAGDPALDPAPTRMQLYAHALVAHAVLLGAAVGAARVERLSLFPSPTLRLRDGLAAAIALIAVLWIGELSWRFRSAAERDRLWVRRILPRTAAERRAWVLVSAGAAIAEEVAYRGVFVAIVSSLTGSLALAVIASAAAFALVHAPQGVAGVAYVFVIALIHQALVMATGTLVLAIVVHFAYDVLAGLWLARRHGLVTTAGCGLRTADSRCREPIGRAP